MRWKNRIRLIIWYSAFIVVITFIATAILFSTQIFPRSLASFVSASGLGVLGALLSGLAVFAGYAVPTFSSFRKTLDKSEIDIKTLVRTQEALSKVLDKRSKNAIEEIIESKKKVFLNPGISFHYADHKQIKVFYDITFKEAIVESVVSERAGETSGQIKGSIASVIDGTVSGKDATKLVSNIKLPDTSSNEMFYRYQKETINTGQVSLGIEEVEVEETELKEFEETIGKLNQKFSFVIDPIVLDDQRKKLREKAVEKTLVKLEQVSNWVLIEGKFKIEKAGNLLKCVYSHPVNAYIAGQVGPVTMSAFVSKDSLEDHSKDIFEQLEGGQPIPLKIYGKVLQQIDRHNNVWDLKLTPLAIY